MMIRCLYSIILLKIAYTDYVSQKIYDRYPCCIVVLTCLQMCSTSAITWQERFMAMVLVAALLLVIAICLPHSLGGGDMKFMAASGLLLGVEAVWDALCLAVAAAFGYILFRAAFHKLHLKETFAFGPFLAFGLFIAAWWHRC